MHVYVAIFSIKSHQIFTREYQRDNEGRLRQTSLSRQIISVIRKMISPGGSYQVTPIWAKSNDYISGLARPQGRQKKKINPSKIPPKAIKPKAEPGHYIGVNVWIFWQFSHAKNKGFPNSDWYPTLPTCSTHILPKL